MDERSPKICPKCNRHGMCIDSNEHAGYVRRRYRCVLMDCGHRWTTAEFLVGQGAVQSGIVHEFIDSLGRRSAKDQVDKNKEKVVNTINRAIDLLREVII